MATNSNLLNFNEALAYLQSKGHPLSSWGMRKEVKNFPDRFGACRRNPLATRGRGGRFFFPKEALDKYTSLQETFVRK
jgi:hypothetical protein